MPANFLHGVEVVELTQGVRPLQTVRSAVIGLIGTAPNADASVYPLNEPVLISGSRAKANQLGAGGTHSSPPWMRSLTRSAPLLLSFGLLRAPMRRPQSPTRKATAWQKPASGLFSSLKAFWVSPPRF